MAQQATITAARRAKKAGERRKYVFSFANRSEVLAGETLASPSVPAVSGLTVAAVAVTAADFADPESGELVPAGQGVECVISGGTAGTDYALLGQATTSGGAVLECPGTLGVE